MNFAVLASASVSMALLVLGCSTADKEKAKEVGNEIEVKAKQVGKKIEVEAKKDEKLAEKKIVIGAPVDFAQGMKALCDAAPADARPETVQAAVAETTKQHPNEEVLQFWGTLNGTPMADRPAKMKPMIERAGLTSCLLADRLQATQPK